MKTLTLKIKSRKKANEELLRVAKKLDQGKSVSTFSKTYFESLEAICSTLTENRLNLWRIIRNNEPSSVNELAKISKQSSKRIQLDLNLLAEVGLIKLKKYSGSVRPLSIADRIRFKVA